MLAVFKVQVGAPCSPLTGLSAHCSCVDQSCCIVTECVCDLIQFSLDDALSPQPSAEHPSLSLLVSDILLPHILHVDCTLAALWLPRCLRVGCKSVDCTPAPSSGCLLLLLLLLELLFLPCQEIWVQPEQPLKALQPPGQQQPTTSKQRRCDTKRHAAAPVSMLLSGFCCVLTGVHAGHSHSAAVHRVRHPPV